MMRLRSIAALVLLAAACHAEDPDAMPELHREDVGAGKADFTADDLCRLLDEPMGCDPCEILGFAAGCDVCEEVAFYGDGVCDAFCEHVDPDCGLENEVCASLFGDGYFDCIGEGGAPTECVPTGAYERPYGRLCCDDNDYAYCGPLACADAASDAECLALDGCAWGDDGTGQTCVFVGCVQAQPEADDDPLTCE